MPAGGQALRRNTRIGIRYGSETRQSTIPDLLGAIMLKSAAWTVDKTAARDRHLRDAALLLSLMDEPESQLERLHSVNDRRRVILLHDELTEMDWLQRIGWFRGGGLGNEGVDGPGRFEVSAQVHGGVKRRIVQS